MDEVTQPLPPDNRRRDAVLVTLLVAGCAVVCLGVTAAWWLL